MAGGVDPAGLKLTEEEAFSLLGLCLTSPTKLDVTAEMALKKLAEYCSECNYPITPANKALACELR